jgi:hypothetical protein
MSENFVPNKIATPLTHLLKREAFC